MRKLLIAIPVLGLLLWAADNDVEKVTKEVTKTTYIDTIIIRNDPDGVPLGITLVTKRVSTEGEDKPVDTLNISNDWLKTNRPLFWMALTNISTRSWIGRTAYTNWVATNGVIRVPDRVSFVPGPGVSLAETSGKLHVQLVPTPAEEPSRSLTSWTALFHTAPDKPLALTDQAQ